MGSEKLDRLKKMNQVVENANLKQAKEAPKKEQKTDQKPTTKRKHIIIPLEWDEVIKNNYGGTFSSYALSAIRKQLESDGYL